MSDMTVARRYAQALLQEAEQRGATEQIDRDVEQVSETLHASRDLTRFFGSPLISPSKKKAVVDRLFTERVHPLLVRFMHLLIDKKRDEIFPVMVRAYQQLRDEQLGIVEAEAQVATPLSTQETDKLGRQLEALTGKRVRVRVVERPELIGGAIVRIGDTVFNGSVRHQLNVLRSQMEQGRYRGNGHQTAQRTT